MTTFKLRETAENDLVNIGLESRAHWGDNQMRQYLKSLDDAFQALATMPEMGRQCSEIKPGYRRLAIRSHVIFYRLAELGDVDIVRILHARMDPELHLADDEL